MAGMKPYKPPKMQAAPKSSSPRQMGGMSKPPNQRVKPPTPLGGKKMAPPQRKR